jgi:phosphate transport system substrate-binding protein
MQLRGRRQLATVGGAVAVALLAACSSSSSSSSSSTPATSGSSSAPSSASSSGAALSGTLNGSGSTFQANFQAAAIQSFKTVQSGMTVNYGGGGSGKGRTDLASGVVNYAGSDSPIPSKEASNFTGKTILYFPVVIGPITLAYNLSGVSNLKLDAPTIAGIFQGKIKTWDDPAIKAINPGVSLPSTTITTAVRSDSSGTTQNFSLYLMDATPSTWTLGSSSIITWPSTARAAMGNSGVAQVIKSTSGAIGYVDYSTAHTAGLTTASIKNKAGDYVAPSPTASSLDAADVALKPDLTFAAANASSNPGAYPITYQSWVLVNESQPSTNDAAMLKAYIGYLLSPAGQQILPTLGYAPLPASIDTMATAQLSKIGM